MSKESGILCPIFSLMSNEGIGTLGKGAFEFVDLLESIKQKYWQILPIGITSYGDSPYQSYSSFAGNPYFIDLEILAEKGFLEKSDLQIDWGNLNYVDYELLWNVKNPLLKKSFDNSNFTEKNYNDLIAQWTWLEDYCLFMSLKEKNGNKALSTWNNNRTKDSLTKQTKKELLPQCLYHAFLQKEFYEQWFALKKYANKKGIQIIGDLPIFVSSDSAELWAEPEVFLNDHEGKLSVVAGVPPDYFSETGQLWGNPLYNWEHMELTDFKWWINRIGLSLELFDVLRIDHFRAFESYWAVVAGSETAINGHWEKAKGEQLFMLLKLLNSSHHIIAEDLGIITDEVRDLMAKTGFAGMAVLHFAFGGDDKNAYLPHNLKEHVVLYTGTHDNNTTRGWLEESENENAVQDFKQYVNGENLSSEELVNKMIEIAMNSVANIVIIPIQDIFCLGQEARINTPSTLGNNWKWRINETPNEYAKIFIKELTIKNNRNL